MTLEKEINEHRAKQYPGLRLEPSIMGVVLAVLDARFAVQDEQIARLRREMDALREALQYSIDDTVEPSETGHFLSKVIRMAGEKRP
mgnify:CR=1 FL=1